MLFQPAGVEQSFKADVAGTVQPGNADAFTTQILWRFNPCVREGSNSDGIILLPGHHVYYRQLLRPPEQHLFTGDDRKL